MLKLKQSLPVWRARSQWQRLVLVEKLSQGSNAVRRQLRPTRQSFDGDEAHLQIGFIEGFQQGGDQIRVVAPDIPSARGFSPNAALLSVECLHPPCACVKPRDPLNNARERNADGHRAFLSVTTTPIA